jgi:hypothetical protein
LGAVDLTVNKQDEKRLKKQKLRNSEYYDMQSVFDKLHEQAKERRKFNSLLEIISCEDNILLAYRNIKKNDGSKTKGTDGRTIEFYKGWVEDKFVKYF